MTIYFYGHNKQRLGNKAVFSQWYQRCFYGALITEENTKAGWSPPHDLTEALGKNAALLDNQEFYCREQWMMACKALLFNSLDAYYKIIRCSDPKKCKQIGRQIKNFSEEVWKKWRFKIVVNGNYLQFSQDEEMKAILLGTGNQEIVEASPYDRIWGIGFSAGDAEKNRDKWGLNLLGKALMSVREVIKSE